MSECEYVTGVTRKNQWQRINDATGMATCARYTNITLYDPFTDRNIPICEPHAVYSKPIWEWTDEDYKLMEEVD